MSVSRNVEIRELLPRVALNIETVSISDAPSVSTLRSTATSHSDKSICHVSKGKVAASFRYSVDGRKIRRIFSLLRGTANPAARVL